MDFLENTIMRAIQERDTKPTKEPLHDFLELMMKIRDKEVTNYSIARLFLQVTISCLYHIIYNLTVLITLIESLLLSLQFFLDGFDTIGSQLAITLYYLAANPEVQELAREEADRVVETKLGGDEKKLLTHEDTLELKYIDQIFSEACRAGTVPFTTRRCTKDYQFPGPDGFLVKKDTMILFQMAGLHVS